MSIFFDEKSFYRMTMAFFGRQQWLNARECLHGIMFTPTMLFNWTSGTWSEYSELEKHTFDEVQKLNKVRRIWESEIELFTHNRNDGRYFYAGVYVLRRLGEAGDKISASELEKLPESVKRAIVKKAHAEKCGAESLAKLPNGRIPVECWGLECRGFNRELYNTLRARYQAVRRQAGELAVMETAGENLATRRKSI
ncbi:hypothetical protein C8R47DRAFT_1075734 [Mycena vitilis]|nr:hypothetical protein C8R47DRAFT_1075734 [Mycena vitilis]